MPTPVEGDIFVKGDKRTVTFVLGRNIAALTNWAGKITNHADANANITFNSAQITIVDNATGTISVSATFNNSGRHTAQFSGNNNTLKEYSQLFDFRVKSPLTAF